MSSDRADAFGADWPPPEPARPHPPAGHPSAWDRIKQAFAPLVAFLALVIKLKSVLFLGSMAVSIAAYAQLWGWKFAVGFVVLLLVHEFGHVIALRMRGIRASAVVFLPLLGAFTSWAPKERDPYQEAETALAGPVIGAAGGLALAAYAHTSGSNLMRALAFTALLLNLFNLIPLVPLDGGRVADLIYPWVWVVVGIGLVGYLVVRPEPLVVVILLLVGYELYSQSRRPVDERLARVEPRHRWRLSWTYLALIVAIVIGMHATYAARTLS
ncbi:MAG TPA: site-2 protease family protein [Mycobacteriales bacterium]|nr:site-2 protease family protein [Mycobacteriales bacterium]